jgi:FHS family Na+ dependent glucose MFS transporter 1
LPEFAARTGSPLAAVGAIFAAISLGGTFTKLVCGPIGERVGQRVVLLAGLFILILGLAGVVASRSLPVLLGCAVIAGIGLSAVDFGGNLLVATTFGQRNTTALNFLHLCFGLGSVLGPAAVSLGLRTGWTGRTAVVLPIVVAIALLPACLALRVPRPDHSSPSPATGSSIYRTPLVWIFAAFLGVFTGVQLGMGGWASTYLTVTAGMPAVNAALVTSGYWLALSVGRLIATLLGTRFSPYNILAVDVAGGCLTSLVMRVAMGNQLVTIGALLLMGLSFGSVYPTMVALLAATFRSAPGKAASVIMTAGSLASMILPPLQGVLLTGLGPASTPWFAVTCCLLLAVLLAGITRAAARSSSQGK